METKIITEMEGYVVPKSEHIPRNGDSAILYDSEQRATEALLNAADDYQSYQAQVNGKIIDRWREAVPAELMHLLDSVDSCAAAAAAIGYLQARNYRISS